MTSAEYQAPTWVNKDDPAFIEGVSPDLGSGYLNQLARAVAGHGQRLGAITPVVTTLQNTALDQAAGDNRYILQTNANGFAPAEPTATALAGKQPLDADLTALAGLDSATAGTVASDGAGWVKKTYAQLRTALGLATIATSGKLGDATDVTTTGAAVGQLPAVDDVSPLHFALLDYFKILVGNPDLLITGTITRDSNGTATSAPVVWPDGRPGVYTATTVSAAFPGAVDAYTITYDGIEADFTYTQPAVTRNANGAVTARPGITVA